MQELNLRKEDLCPLTLIYHEQGIREYTAECLREQFKEYLEIECDLKPLPWNSIFNRFTGGHFQIGLMHWTSWINDPIYTLNAFKSAKQEINFAKWENPDFHALLDLSEQEIDPVQRSSYLIEAQKILNREMPIVPLFYQPYQALIHKDLHVVCRTPLGSISKSFYQEV